MIYIVGSLRVEVDFLGYQVLINQYLLQWWTNFEQKFP